MIRWAYNSTRHDMMNQKISIYIDDMIDKSCREKDHVIHLRKLKDGLRQFQMQ